MSSGQSQRTHGDEVSLRQQLDQLELQQQQLALYEQQQRALYEQQLQRGYLQEPGHHRQQRQGELDEQQSVGQQQHHQQPREIERQYRQQQSGHQHGQQDQQQFGQQPPRHAANPSRYAAMLANERAWVDVNALHVRAEGFTGMVLYTMKRQKRKDVWHFARLIRSDKNSHIERKDLNNEHAEEAYCLLCTATLNFRLGKCKMAKHVEKEHPVELKTYVAQAAQAASGGGEPVIRNLATAFESVADEGKKKKLRTITVEQQSRLNELIAEWVARHFRPLIIVQDEGFVAFIRYITEDVCGIKVDLPDRSKVRHEIVCLAVAYRRRVRDAIVTGCWFFSMTCDIWTARNTKSYISLTIHYVDDDFRPQNWTLEVRELPGIHEGSVIALAIEQIMEAWMLQKQNCVVLLRDSGSNMVAAGDILGVKHMACVAHCLHLVVGGAMIKKKKKSGDADEPAWAAEVAAESSGVVVPEHEEEAALTEEDRSQIEDIRELAIEEMEKYLDDTIASLRREKMGSVRAVVQRFRTLAVYFRRSAKGSHRLGTLQVQHLNVKEHEVKTPIVDCATRWNSCWKMLQRMIELEAALVKFFAHLKQPEGRKEFKDVGKKLRRPKAEEWLTIKCLQTLLGPFAVASETLGGQAYPTMPLVLPALSGIRKHLERTDLFSALAAEAGEESYVPETVAKMNECRKVMLELYEARFKEVENSELRWVAFLDPRVGKWMSHLSPADTPSASNALVEAMVELARECLPAEGSECRRQTPIQVSAEQHRNFMYHHMFGPDIVPSGASDLSTECKKEFSRYLEAIARVKSTVNPFTWWQVNGTNYPNLRRLARKWLGSVATSVPSERAFSTSGNILTVKRSSLKPDMVRDLVFLAENWKGINALTPHRRSGAA